jgi:hypothetical protein
MAVPFTELEIATRRHFMPVVMNQIWKVSPVLYRIFRPSKAGSWGLAVPSFDGREIVEPLEIAEAASGGTQHGAYNSATTWQYGTTEVMTGAHYGWKINLKYVFLKFALIQGILKLKTLTKL